MTAAQIIAGLIVLGFSGLAVYGGILVARDDKEKADRQWKQWEDERAEHERWLEQREGD